MTMVGENGPPPDGWAPQPGKHCGEICCDIVCPVCREYVSLGSNITLGSE